MRYSVNQEKEIILLMGQMELFRNYRRLGSQVRRTLYLKIVKYLTVIHTHTHTKLDIPKHVKVNILVIKIDTIS
jgi:hypothetical protein